MKFLDDMKKPTSFNLGTINKNGTQYKSELPKDIYRQKRKQDWIRFLAILVLSHLGSFLILSAGSELDSANSYQEQPGKMPIAISLINKSSKEMGEVSLISKGKVIVQKATLIKKEQKNNHDFMGTENSETWIIAVSERDLPQFIQRSQVIWEAYPPVLIQEDEKKEFFHEIIF